MRDESTLFRDLIAFALEWKERLTLISMPYLTHSKYAPWRLIRGKKTHSLMTIFSSSKQAHTSAAIPIPSRYSMTDDNNSFLAMFIRIFIIHIFIYSTHSFSSVFLFSPSEGVPTINNCQNEKKKSSRNQN